MEDTKNPIVEQFEESVELSSVDAYIHRGTTRYNEGRYKEAIEDFDLAIEQETQKC